MVHIKKNLKKQNKTVFSFVALGIIKSHALKNLQGHLYLILKANSYSYTWSWLSHSV